MGEVFRARDRTTAGLPYLVMEWLEGEDLGSLLARRELTIHESVELLARVAEILAVMHAQGIVHRDLKPINLFPRRARDPRREDRSAALCSPRC